MESFMRYGIYKDSCVEWIGRVPEGWTVDKLKRSVVNLKNGVWGDESNGDENDVFCVRVADFNRNNFEVDTEEFTIRNLEKDKQRAYLLKKGDLLIEKSGGGEKQPVGFVVRYHKDEPAVYANFMARMDLNREIAYSNFFKYVHSSLYAQRINARSIKQTTGIQNLDTNLYLQEYVAYPPLEEQIYISEFLDQKTAEIDKLIADKTKLLSLLDEHRQTIITEAITKGIDSNIKMKRTGLEWVVEMPEHWNVRKIKHVLSYIEYGISESGKGEGEYKILTMGNINNGEITFPNDGALNDLDEKYLVDTNDLLFNRTNSLEQIAKVGIFRGSKEDKITFASYLVRLKVKKEEVDSEYLNYLLNCRNFITYARSFAIQSISQANLNANRYTNLPIILPSLNEQIRIKKWLINQTKNIADVIKEITDQIMKLKEYRQSLIFEVVTGKIDVRDVAAEVIETA
ncbi:restriction endonuclease subunit S [Paenibacillus polymyxa]|uniref:restriction endonuclease subunit S n=1 Tax=Paenibacillus polymyxa TaxID=1406 RepID=UPI002019755B|nr:restriction endonuclease subunit S [Paenibacillus polymyxa]UQQ36179.1 restriction endonuclease subunit S [Paenibacillus polymyxa]